MECKICNKSFEGKIGLNTHIRQHNINPLDYYIEYEGLIIPKCTCGRDCKKNKKDMRFQATCGNTICIKKIQRTKRLQFMKDHPEKTAWRLTNLSYPEKLFKEKCEILKLHEKHLIIRERSIFPYFIDFAFENEKVAVEIDGSQHELKEKKDSDKRKEKLIIEDGWRLIRFTAKDIQWNIDLCFEKLFYFISSDTKSEAVGLFENSYIINEKKDKLKEELNRQRQRNSGLTDLQMKSAISQRLVDRPSLKQLLKETSELGFSAVGRKYGVSDNAVRKWIETYEKYKI